MKANVKLNSIANELDDVLDRWDAVIKEADRNMYRGICALIVVSLAVMAWLEWWR